MIYTSLRGSRNGGGLWLLVLAAMVLDVASTAVGLSLGLVELNPIAVVGIDALGVIGLSALKVPALAIGFAGWRTLNGRYRQWNLFGLALPWTGAVAVNGWLILGTL